MDLKFPLYPVVIGLAINVTRGVPIFVYAEVLDVKIEVWEIKIRAIIRDRWHQIIGRIKRLVFVFDAIHKKEVGDQ